MKNLTDFNEFVDLVVIKAAEFQNSLKVASVSLKDLAQAVKPDVPPTWIEMLEGRLRDLDYGKLRRDNEFPGLFHFKINSRGLARAHEVKKAKRVPSLTERLRDAPWAKIFGETLKLVAAALFGAFATSYFGR